VSSIWDDPEINNSGDFVKFDNVGDEVVGTIKHIGRKVWDDGKVCPQLELDTAEGPKTLTAGQVRLKVALAEKRPEQGDRIRVRLTQIEKRAGGKTLKHFQVDVQRGGSAGGAASVPAQAAPAPAEPVAAASADIPF
jgi:hypothetical protein